MKEKDLKTIVREKYGQIAAQADALSGQAGCCSGSGCCGPLYTTFNENYEELVGYAADADLGLGCGLPTEFAGLEPGQYVLDLGSGAGNDCFVARAIVGDTGWVTGLDFSDEMLERARKNARKLGHLNVDFIAGDIDDMPLDNDHFDVVLSNCVLNLVPDKTKAFSEVFRVLKPGGHFCISDVVLKGELPDALKTDAEMYAGCVSGALSHEEYIEKIGQAGFSNIRVHKLRQIEIPREIFYKYLSVEAYHQFNKEGRGIFSLTISADKPAV